MAFQPRLRAAIEHCLGSNVFAVLRASSKGLGRAIDGSLSTASRCGEAISQPMIAANAWRHIIEDCLDRVVRCRTRPVYALSGTS